ncbi:YHS domain-containing protein [Geoalkalibacter halelectricus]|uniref:YHS domain-containing protein n=1 Tax=Geoalkalibacter halelectricus TaxID=2847045 RepID=UPI003D24A8E8
MTRLLILTLLLCVGYSLWTYLRRALGGRRPPQASPPRRRAGGRQGEDLVQDPQCGTYVPRSEAVEAQVGGARLYFCSTQCRDAFRARQG